MKTARLIFYMAVAAIMAALFYLLLIRPIPVDTSHFQQTIDSLNTRISGHEKTIELLKMHRDTIRDTIYRTRVIREQIPGQVATLPPDQLLTTWDTLTGAGPQTRLTTDSVAITTLPRLRAGTIALLQVPLYEKEIGLQRAEIANIDKQSAHKDTIISEKNTIISTHQAHNRQLAETNGKLRKKVLFWQVVAGVLTIIAIW